MHHRITRASDPQIGRADTRGCRDDRQLRLRRIAGTNHGHVGQRAHHRNILKRMVRRTIGPVAVSTANTHDAHRQVVIAHVVADLLQTSQCGERRDGVGKRPHATQRQARRYADHVGFGHANVQKSTGELAGKRVEDLVTQIAGQQHDSRIATRRRGEPANERRPHPQTSARARRRSSSVGGR